MTSIDVTLFLFVINVFGESISFKTRCLATQGCQYRKYISLLSMSANCCCHIFLITGIGSDTTTMFLHIQRMLFTKVRSKEGTCKYMHRKFFRLARECNIFFKSSSWYHDVKRRLTLHSFPKILFALLSGHLASSN